MRLAIVTEDLTQYGGAERVVEVLHAMYPDAPIYTSLFHAPALPAIWSTWDIRTSFLQRIPFGARMHRALLLAYPAAYESFDLSGYDVVLSVSSRFANGVITPPSTLHVNYCLTPMRFAWSYREYVEREALGSTIRAVLPAAMHYLRLWDVAASQRVDRFVAISSVVQERVQKYYRRPADLIFPPVDAEAMPCGEGGEDYVVVSRLVPYKRIDLAVDACSQLGAGLVISGSGRSAPALAARAGPPVRLAGRLSDVEARALMGRARAFLFPGYEDFGITPLEAMAAGTPVIAYRAGGALDTIVEGVTGRLFEPQTVSALADTIRGFRPEDYDRGAIRSHALTFDRRHFEDRMRGYITDAWAAAVESAFARPKAASL
jgi:glycosyltransferase involved in cell wall biosynthesis